MAEQSSLQAGLDCLRSGKIEEAIEHLEKAGAESPTDYRAFNFLGVAYAQRNFYDRAIGAFQRAVQLRHDIPSIHYNLGLALQADGFPDMAREHLQRALELDPSYDKATQALKALDAEGKDSTLHGQSCARHTDEPAVALCSFCHLPVCNGCKTVVEGQILCPGCIPKR